MDYADASREDRGPQADRRMMTIATCAGHPARRAGRRVAEPHRALTMSWDARNVLIPPYSKVLKNLIGYP